ncbi:MAG TPA: hypothetical protein VFE51_21850 [Verrucomicrobiae bacterium]|nr:hypothetical protein [Verrucomicrobiae bacterium]
MTINEIEEIEQRAERATPGPWYWRVGKHTEDKKTSDAGGLHTRTPIESFTPDGRRFDNDNVIFPAGKVGGEPYWLERFQKANAAGKPTLTIALECVGKDEDKHFIASAREDVPALIVEIHRLRKLLADLGAPQP